VEVVRMTPELESKHLGKILDRLASAQKVKAEYIVSGKCICDINVKIEDITREHKSFKEAYQL
jgi:hypothetical protein